MSSSEDERNDQFTHEQIDEIKRISKLRRQEHAERFQVSGWEDDTEGIEEESDPHGKPETEILWAAENGDLDLVIKLVTANPELLKVKDKDGYTPLHRACYSGHSHVSQWLLSAGADISAQTNDLWQPLHSACKWNNALCAGQLLDFGADINCQSKGGLTPLHVAASNGQARETLELLLMYPNLNPHIKNDNNETAFDIAWRSGTLYKLFEIIDPVINVI